MVRTRKERKAESSGIKLAHPDRSGPSEATLLDLAQERNLFDEADRTQAMRKKKSKKPTGQKGSDADDEDEEEEDEIAIPPAVDRIMETVLWSVCLAMLHFAFDVLVQRQFSMEFSWPQIVTRALQAWISKCDTNTGPSRSFAFLTRYLLPSLVFLVLFYVLHYWPSAPTLLPGLPERYQSPLRQTIFFATSVYTGCHLIYITNEFDYMAVLKRAPPVGCLWVWSVIELDLLLSVLSLAITGGFFYQGGYTIK